MYLCEVAIVSQLCISFPYVLHGLCEDYLTCDIAFNAVMPPSRASTRGRYRRIEGVTLGDAPMHPQEIFKKTQVSKLGDAPAHPLLHQHYQFVFRSTIFLSLHVLCAMLGASCF